MEAQGNGSEAFKRFILPGARRLRKTTRSVAIGRLWVEKGLKPGCADPQQMTEAKAAPAATDDTLHGAGLSWPMYLTLRNPVPRLTSRKVGSSWLFPALLGTTLVCFPRRQLVAWAAASPKWRKSAVSSGQLQGTRAQTKAKLEK